MPGWDFHRKRAREWNIKPEVMERVSRVLDDPPPGMTHQQWRKRTHNALAPLIMGAVFGRDAVRATALHLIDDKVFNPAHYRMGKPKRRFRF